MNKAELLRASLMTPEQIAELKKENEDLKTEIKELESRLDSSQEDVMKQHETIMKMRICARCMSFQHSLEEEPCKSCYKDGVNTNWH